MTDTEHEHIKQIAISICSREITSFGGPLSGQDPDDPRIQRQADRIIRFPENNRERDIANECMRAAHSAMKTIKKLGYRL